MSTPTPGLPEEAAAAPIPPAGHVPPMPNPAVAGAMPNPAGHVPPMPNPAVAGAMPTFTPLTAPRPRATGGQITIAVISSVLVVLFAITTLMGAGIYSMKSKDLTETQEELSTVQQELQEAQEAAK